MSLGVRMYSAGRGIRRAGRPPYPRHAVLFSVPSLVRGTYEPDARTIDRTPVTAAAPLADTLPPSPGAKPLYLKELDFGVLAQCIHCGLCLPTCPTYDATKLEKNSPRGRIQLMRNVAEGRLDITEAFGDEMYFCLG